jgi:hypothetical protein
MAAAPPPEWTPKFLPTPVVCHDEHGRECRGYSLEQMQTMLRFDADLQRALRMEQGYKDQIAALNQTVEMMKQVGALQELKLQVLQQRMDEMERSLEQQIKDKNKEKARRHGGLFAGMGGMSIGSVVIGAVALRYALNP